LGWILSNSYGKLTRCWLLLLLMLLGGTVELRFMFRLLFTIISPLIMIHMMSCEYFV
jgi:hypothetical protein